MHDWALTDRIFTFGSASVNQHLSLSISQIFQCMLLSEVFQMVPNFICRQIGFFRKKIHKIAVMSKKIA